MHLSRFQQLALLGLWLTIAPCSSYVHWLYPPSSSSRSLSFNYNDLVYFTWESNFTDPTVILWCASAASYYNVFSTSVPTSGSTAQSFPYGQSFNQSCHLSLYCHNNSSCGPVGQSAEFSLTHDQAAAAQTWGAAATASVGKTATSATATSASSTTSSSSSAVTAPAAATSATVPTPRVEHGLSTSAKAGIGLGAIVGGVAVVMGVWLFMAWVRRKREEERYGFPSSERDKGGMGMTAEFETVGMARQEMDGEGRVGELGGTARAELGGMSPVR